MSSAYQRIPSRNHEAASVESLMLGKVTVDPFVDPITETRARSGPNHG